MGRECLWFKDFWGLGGWDVDQFLLEYGAVIGLQWARASHQAGPELPWKVTWSTVVSRLELTLPDAPSPSSSSFSAPSGAAAASKDLPFVHQTPGTVLQIQRASATWDHRYSSCPEVGPPLSTSNLSTVPCSYYVAPEFLMRWAQGHMELSNP